MVNKSLPDNPKRVLLVNPTKYLGNLLIAGGLMQAYARYCREQGIDLRILIDAAFYDLCVRSFPDGMLLTFPRRAINRAGVWQKLALYYRTVTALRRFQADLAFNIEEDSATSHLTRLSGAVFNMGCSIARHRQGYDHVVPVQFENRPAGREHRWYSLYEVFAELGMPEPEKSYLTLASDPMADSLETRLARSGWLPQETTIALHAGATKDYKKWPLAHMAALVEKLQHAGLQPVLIGAGGSDQHANAEITRLLAARGAPAPVDLCNQLSLIELAQFLRHCKAMVGNDSGPFHLGSALGVPGLVLWGPTNQAVWGPMGQHSSVITGSFTCDPACNKGHCLHEHQCMQAISPDQVMRAMEALV